MAAAHGGKENVADPRHPPQVVAQSRAHDHPTAVVVLGPYEAAVGRVPLVADMDDVLGEVDVVMLEPETLAWADGRLADGEGCPFDDQSVLVGAACPGASAEARVLLVGDDLEVRPVDPALALASTEARERVRSISSRSRAWLKNWRTDCCTLAPRASAQVIASSRPKLSVGRSPNSRMNGRSASRIRRTVDGFRPVFLCARWPAGQIIVTLPSACTTAPANPSTVGVWCRFKSGASTSSRNLARQRCSAARYAAIVRCVPTHFVRFL